MTPEQAREAGFTVHEGANENALLEFLRRHYPHILRDGELNLYELKKELGIPVDEKVNGYGLNFIGRNVAKGKYAQETAKCLRVSRELSKNFDTTGNIVLKGDNLDCLKILKSYYRGKINMIYIDPPYNTDNDEFTYPDKWDKEEAEVLGLANLSETEMERLEFSFGNKKSHNGWLSFMYPRLMLARDLLAKNGVIFISIDDNEQANLKILCDEIFGEENFVACSIRRTINSGKHDTNTVAAFHEYVLMYCKDISRLVLGKKRKTDEEKDKLYKESDEFENERGKFYVSQLNKSSIQYSDSLNFPIKGPDGIDVWAGNGFDDKKWCWRWGKQKVKWGIENGYIVFKKQGGKYKVYAKSYEFRNNSGEPIERTNPYSTLEFVAKEYGNFNATPELSELFGGEGVFDFPKSVLFLNELLQLAVPVSSSLASVVGSGEGLKPPATLANPVGVDNTPSLTGQGVSGASVVGSGEGLKPPATFANPVGVDNMPSLTGQETLSAVRSRLRQKFEELAVPLERVAFTPENFRKLFGRNSVVKTPIGEVKIGNNQYQKLLERKREDLLWAMKETLRDPVIILNEKRDGQDALLFFKSFLKDERETFIVVMSVVVNVGDIEVAVSTYQRRNDQVLEKITSPADIVYENNTSRAVRPCGYSVNSPSPHKESDTPRPTLSANSEISQEDCPIVLDFFAGSGTTGHAVMQHNAERGSNVKFILCQIDEPLDPKKKKTAFDFCTEHDLPPVISSITVERLNRAGEKILADKSRPLLQSVDLDIGYKVFDLVDAPHLELSDDHSPLIKDNAELMPFDRIVHLIFKVGVDNPAVLPDTVVLDCMYRIGNNYYVTNSETLDTKENRKKLKAALSDGGNVFVDGWTATLNTTLQANRDKDTLKIVF